MKVAKLQFMVWGSQGATPFPRKTWIYKDAIIGIGIGKVSLFPALHGYMNN